MLNYFFSKKLSLLFRLATRASPILEQIPIQCVQRVDNARQFLATVILMMLLVILRDGYFKICTMARSFSLMQV